MIQENGLYLVKQLSEEQKKEICLKLDVKFDKNSQWLVPTLEHLCDYGKFKLRKEISGVISVEYHKISQ